MSTYTDRLKLRIDASGNAQQEINRTQSALSGLSKAAIGVGVAFGAFKTVESLIGPAISKAADFEATMQSLEAVVGVTGRNMNDVLAAMESQVGGLASEASIASGFLKGMTTELNVKQMNNMTTAIRDASIAMGEDFNQQFPLIIKAIKQLNPAILDNIGVTVRLDKVNKRITDGFYGAGTAINEFTQQNAIYQEIIKQTAKFQGQEAALLETTKGKWLEFTTAVDDASVALGTLILEGEGANTILEQMTRTIIDAKDAFEDLSNARGFFETLFLLIPTTNMYVSAMIRAREATEALDLSLISSHLSEEEIALRQRSQAADALMLENLAFSQSINQLIIEDNENLINDSMADDEEWNDWKIEQLENRLQREINVQRQAYLERTKVQRYFDEKMQSAANQAVTDHLNAWIDGREQFQNIWKNMFKDFHNLLIKKMLEDVAFNLIGSLGGGGLLGIFGGIFGGLFGGGRPAGSGNLSGYIGPPSPAATAPPVIILNIGDGGQGDDTLARILPALEDAANNGESTLVTRQSLIDIIGLEGGTNGR
ncbi:MAG: hypothetical protein KAS32_11355 [Candidatus Peribacteraceae bacterium]|nr:hypothetical protein [Candidatus Peribacteraceae bacterium]